MMIDFIRHWIEREVSDAALSAALACQDNSIPPEATVAIADKITPLISAIPDALGFLVRAGKDTHVGRPIELVAGQVLFYLADEEDFLPESQFGVLGLLDDALLVHAVSIQVLTWFPEVDGLRGRYVVPSAAALTVGRDLLPAGMAEAIEQNARALVSVATALFGRRPTANVDVSSETHRLRISEAHATLVQALKPNAS